jgi:hypothetical protein
VWGLNARKMRECTGGIKLFDHACWVKWRNRVSGYTPGKDAARSGTGAGNRTSTGLEERLEQGDPAVGIFNMAVLDVSQGFVELHG